MKLGKVGKNRSHQILLHPDRALRGGGGEEEDHFLRKATIIITTPPRAHVKMDIFIIFCHKTYLDSARFRALSWLLNLAKNAPSGRLDLGINLCRQFLS